MTLDWQTVVALAIALGCAAWVLWYAARPFLTRAAEICGFCSDCSADGDDETELLQIEPAGAEHTPELAPARRPPSARL